MRRGCISLGEVRCDDCHRIIPHLERYLCVEDDSVEEEEGQGQTARYCLDCCMKKGYAHYRVEKGNQIITFLE